MASAKTSRKLFSLFMSAIMVLSLAACAGNAETASYDSGNSAPSDEQITNESSESQEAETVSPESTAAPETDSSEETDSGASDSKILVAYFSHTGENYGVGVIEKGNTHIIADMIAEETGGRLRIVRGGIFMPPFTRSGAKTRLLFRKTTEPIRHGEGSRAAKSNASFYGSSPKICKLHIACDVFAPSCERGLIFVDY